MPRTVLGTESLRQDEGVTTALSSLKMERRMGSLPCPGLLGQQWSGLWVFLGSVALGGAPTSRATKGQEGCFRYPRRGRDLGLQALWGRMPSAWQGSPGSALQGTLPTNRQAGGQIMNTPHFLAAQRHGWKQSLFHSVETTRFSSECPQGGGGLQRWGHAGGGPLLHTAVISKARLALAPTQG